MVTHSQYETSKVRSIIHIHQPHLITEFCFGMLVWPLCGKALQSINCPLNEVIFLQKLDLNFGGLPSQISMSDCGEQVSSGLTARKIRLGACEKIRVSVRVFTELASP